MEPNPQRLSVDRWLLVACVAVIGTALTVIIGWVGDVPALTILMLGGTPMVMNTAVCLLMCGMGLLALAADRRWAAIGCGAFVIAISATGLLQEAIGFSLGVNEILWKHQYVSAAYAPGAMSPNTATALLITGGLVVFMGTGLRRHWVIPLMLGISMAIAFLPLLSYLATYVLTGGRDSYRGMALPTAGSLLVLAGALLRAARIAGWRESMALSYMAAAFGMLISIGVFAVQSNRAMITANAAVVRTYEVRSDISHFVERVARMESSARGYALTGDESFRDRAFAHQQDVRQRLEAVFSLVADNLGQVRRTIQLRQLAEEKFKSSDELMRLRREQGATAAADYLLAQPNVVGSGLVQLADEVQAEEGRLLAKQEAARREIERTNRVMQVMGSLLAFGLLGIAVATARSETRARQAAEATLLKVNHLQRAVLDGTVLSIIATEPDGLIREFNTGAEQMLGYRREEMVGRHTPELIHVAGEVVARATELSARLGQRVEPGFETFVLVARQGKVDEREWTYVRKDGTRFPVRLSVTALRDATGTITGFLGVAQDLSAQRQAALALRRSEDRLQQVLGHADCLVWEARVILTEKDWAWSFTIHPSGMFTRLFGENHAGQAGLWYQFEIPEQQEMNVRSREAMLGGANGYVQEFRLIRSGGITWIRESVSIVRTDGQHFWLVGVATDVTRMRGMTAALEQSEERFRNAFDYAGVGMALVGLDGRWLQINRMVHVMLGYTEADLLARTFQEVTHPEDLQLDLANVEDLLAGHRRHYQMEKRYIHKEGRAVHVRLTVSLVRDAAGAPLHFIAQIEDITARYLAEQAVVASQRQLTDVFRSMAEGLVLHDAQGKIIECNAAAENILGLSRAQLMSSTLFDPHWETLNEDGSPCPADRHPAVITRMTGQNQRGVVMGVRKPDGSLNWLSVNSEAILEEDGHLRAVVVSFADVTERKQVAEALAESEERVRLAASVAGLGVWDWDLKTNQVTWDRQMQVIYGRPDEGGIVDYKVWIGALSADEVSRQEGILQNTISQRGRSQREFVIRRHADGANRVVQSAELVVCNREGHAVRMVGVNRDITEMRESEARQAASEQRLKDVFRSMAEGLVLQDAKGAIVECNEAAQRILGLSRDQMMGVSSMDPRWRTVRSDGSPFPGDEHPAIITLRTGQPCTAVEMGVYKPEGGLTWISINSEPLHTSDHDRRMVVCSFADITTRKMAEVELKESEERIRLFAEHAPASVAMFDREMRYLVHSAKWLKDYGLSGRAIIGRSHYEVFPEIGENWKEIHRRCLAGATEINEADPFERADGHRQWLSWRVQPWRNTAGEIGGIVMFTEDITHRKELEQSLAAARDQALAASKMKSEFLANVSHEIRTPMNGVLGMADLLMDTRLTGDQQQMARVIQSSAQNLLKLIDDLLDFSKIEAGKFSITTDAFSLAEQVDQALALMAPRAVSGQVSLESDLPADLPARLWGDAGRIQQVLVNLLGNAVKFTERGRVTVAVRPLTPAVSGNYAFRIDVRDTGIGITDEQKARLFQPFVQADGSTTRRFGGTGLGLAISRQLIELMNGRIGCESEPGRGSVFWFELELPFAAAPAAARKTASPAPLPQAGARILVAEDQQANQLVMRLLLTKLGLDHTIVADGQAAIEKLGSEDYVLVLMDCQMPRIDGYEATRLIRAGAAGPARQSTPIVALTAHAMASDREKCLEAGMDDYMSKPIRLDALQAILLQLGIPFVPAAAEPVPSVPPAATATALDPGQLAQLRSLPGRTHSSLLEELAGLALLEMPATLAQLTGQVKQESAAEVAQTAHRLAGASANLGALGLRAVLLGIEQAAETADWARARRALADLDREWSVVQQALSDLLPKPPP